MLIGAQPASKAQSMTANVQPHGSKPKRQALGDSSITVVERIVAQASQFAVFIFAANILSPAEFGVFALASACAILLFRAAEAAWAPYIMSWSGDAERPRQVLFLAILSGVAMAVLGQALGFSADMFAMSSIIGPLIHLFSFWIMLATISSALKGLMVWQKKLKASAVCEIASELSGLVASITSLWAGFGIFALVIGRLAAQSVHLVLSASVVRLGPLTSMPKAAMEDLWSFSKQVFTSRMIANLRLYTATFVIGAFLGPVAVGLFRAADRLVIAFAELLMAPGYLLAWTQFRQARDAGPVETASNRINQRATDFFKVIFAASLPLMAWLVLQSEDIITGLLSEEWAAATPLVAILAISRLLMTPSVATEPLLSITGQAKRLPMVTSLTFAFSITVTLIAAQFGLYAVASSQIIVAIGVLALNVWVYQRYASVAWKAVLGGVPALLLPLCAGTLTLWSLMQWPGGADLPALVRVVAYGLGALAVYLSALRVLDPSFVSLILSTKKTGASGAASEMAGQS